MSSQDEARREVDLFLALRTGPHRMDSGEMHAVDDDDLTALWLAAQKKALGKAEKECGVRWSEYRSHCACGEGQHSWSNAEVLMEQMAAELGKEMPNG